LGSKTVKSEL